MTEAKEEMELVFNTSPDAALISRLSDGLIVYANEGFSVLSGFTRDEAVGRTSIGINIWENPEDRNRLVSKILEKGSIDNFEAGLQRKDGSRLIGLISAKTINLQNTAHIISVTRDITERKKGGGRA